MATTIRDLHICLTQEDVRMLDELQLKLQETKSQIIKRALQQFYLSTISRNT